MDDAILKEGVSTLQVHDRTLNDGWQLDIKYKVDTDEKNLYIQTVLKNINIAFHYPELDSIEEDSEKIDYIKGKYEKQLFQTYF